MHAAFTAGAGAYYFAIESPFPCVKYASDDRGGWGGLSFLSAKPPRIDCVTRESC